MTEFGPWMVTARTQEQAEYLIRSRAEQRGVRISQVEASGGDNDMWVVTAQVADTDEIDLAARLGDDTGVIHIDTHSGRPAAPG
jgi:hypothetical protein